MHKVIFYLKDHLKKYLFLLSSSYGHIGEKLYELKAFYFHIMPSDGYMTARLKRMGVNSFPSYVVAQKIGHFGKRNFLPHDKEKIVKKIKKDFPNQINLIIENANRIYSGKLNVLNSGWQDMRRSSSCKGWQIDWAKDPITGEHYKKVFNHWRFDVMKMRPKNADVKGPWELTRCQHLTKIGKAYWLTGDEKYSECFAKTIMDFIKKNPVGFGVHWSCTMDVALRVIGWLTGLSFFQGSKRLSYKWWKIFLKSLVEHGNFIVANLEYGTFNGKIIMSNHSIANLVGLYWLALNFPHLDAACVWRGIAEKSLEQQISEQILEDGSNFESSVFYHGLVTEMFLSAYALSLQFGFKFSKNYKSRLVKALYFIKSLRQKNGRLPQVGDADSGRAHIFSGYGTEDFENLDRLLVAGAKVLNIPDLSCDVDIEKKVEALFWDISSKDSIELPDIENVKIFSNFGLGVIKGNDTYLCMSNGQVGTLGIGNHKHNDQLAIEWVVGNQPFFVDGGSYTYTQDPSLRNKFRGTNFHNTVQVDDFEQHDLNPKWLFRLTQCGEAKLTKRKNNLVCGIEGDHTAYSRLESPLIHKRKALVFLNNGIMSIQDEFAGEKGQLLRWCFLLYPNVDVILLEKNVVCLKGDFGESLFVSSDNLNFNIEDTWYSPAYNMKTKTKALIANKINDLSNVNFVGYPGNKMHIPFDVIIKQSDVFWKKNLSDEENMSSGSNCKVTEM